MRIDPAGWPFVAGAGFLSAVVWSVAGWAAASPLLAFTALFLFFFRDPERQIPTIADAVLSPADGKVLVAGRAVADAGPPGEWQQISIFLSPTDVHVNRTPASGRVTKVSFKPGRFLPAYKPTAASDNERSEIWIDHKGQTIVARQIVGILARRVVCRLKVGDVVRAGDRFGVMKFGSRMDVFLPPTAELHVSVGETVRAGESVIAVLH